MATVRFELPSTQPIEVTVERAAGGDAKQHVVHTPSGDKTVSLTAYDGDRGFVVADHHVQRYCTWRRNDQVEVWIDGKTYRLKLAPKTARRHGITEQAAPAGDILATMPGTILKIELAAGDRFTAHQPLVIMESMKMEMTLSSPHGGRVKEITCRSGQLVEIGTLLIRLETDQA